MCDMDSLLVSFFTFLNNQGDLPVKAKKLIQKIATNPFCNKMNITVTKGTQCPLAVLF